MAGGARLRKVFLLAPRPSRHSLLHEEAKDTVYGIQIFFFQYQQNFFFFGSITPTEKLTRNNYKNDRERLSFWLLDHHYHSDVFLSASTCRVDGGKGLHDKGTLTYTVAPLCHVGNVEEEENTSANAQKHTTI